MNHSHESAKKNKALDKPAGTVSFKTNCSWCGDRETDAHGKTVAAAFNRVAGEICTIPKATAVARAAAGLGEIVEDEDEA